MNWIGPWSAVAGSFTWALGVDVYSELSKKYPPSVVNFSRATVAGPLFVLAFLIQSGIAGTTGADVAALEWSHVGWLVLSAIASYALGDLIFMKASLSSLGAAGALAIASIYPIWSALIGVFYKGEILGGSAVVGLVLVVGGTVGVILSSRDRGSDPHARAYALSLGAATVLAVGASLIWSINIYAVSHIRDVPTSLSNVVRMAAAVVLCPFFGMFILRVRPRLMSRSDYRKAMPIFILEGFGGSILYIYGVSHSSMAMGAVLSSLAPVLSVPIAYILHRAVVPVRKLLSVVLVVVGLWLLIFSRE